MRILATADVYSPLQFDGTTRHFLGVGRGLARRGHDVRAVLPCPDDSDFLTERYPELKPGFYPVSDRSNALRFLTTVTGARREFARRLRGGGFDIIQLNRPRTSIGPILTRGARDIPVVYHLHSPWAVEYEVKSGGRRNLNWEARRFIEKFIFSRCDGFLVLSDYMRARLLEAYPALAGKPIRVVPGGVDSDRFRPSENIEADRATAGLPPDRPVIFTTRSFTPRMGLDNLVEAMTVVVGRHPDVLLVIGGFGPLKHDIENQVKLLELERNVRFDGFIDEALLPLYYRAADLFVLPTRALEGFGLVTLEALSSGTPVVGTPVGGTMEILPQFDPGLLCRDNSAEAIAERLVYWLSEREKLSQLREKCRAFVLENFSWDRVAEKVESFYLELIGNRR